MGGNLEVDTLQELVDAGEIDTVLTCFVDLQGRLMGKRVTGRFFLDSVMHEMEACNYLLTVDVDMEPVPGYKAASWEQGYGDFTVRPDLSTLRRIPWLPGTALVLGDPVDHHGDDLAHSPRAVLKRQVERARAMGYVPKMGSEVELFVFDETFESAAAKGYRGLKPVSRYNEDYHIFQTSKEEQLIRAIRNGMDGAGVPVEFSKGEAWAGQEEINLRYAEAVEMADRHSIYKNGAKEIAFAHGMAITFMAKYDDVAAGSSCHIHSSLWDVDTDEALFSDADDEHGMSKLFRHYLAGQLALSSELTYFFAPYINSYKRYQEETFAPTTAVWGVDNRTTGYRVCGGHGPALRLECRIPGADCNPYLAFAATLAAGLHGIEHELELEPEFRGNAYTAEGVREIPGTLRAALEALDSSEVLRKALGDDVVDHYVHTGRWEQSLYDRTVTDWDLRHNFERI